MAAGRMPWRSGGGLLVVAVATGLLLLLAFLLAEGSRRLEEVTVGRAVQRVERLRPALRELLAEAGTTGDAAALQAVAEEGRRAAGAEYLAVLDEAGRTVAASGWDRARPLPPAQGPPPAAVPVTGRADEAQLDLRVPIEREGRRAGAVQIGLDAAGLVEARRTLLWRGLLAGLLGIAAVVAALARLVVRSARRLEALAESARLAAAGQLPPPPAAEGGDDAGRLGRALNRAWLAVADRLHEASLARGVAEEAARAHADAAERLGRVLDGSQDGFWDWDVPSGAVEFSRRWSEMLGYAPEEVRPHVSAWRELLHPGDAPEVMRVLQDHLAGRSSSYQTEHRLRARSGEWRWVLHRGAVVQRAADGSPLRMAGTHTDITPRKRAEEELRRLNEDMALNLATLTVRNREFTLLGELTTMLQACREVGEAHQVLARILPAFFPGCAGALHLGAPSSGQVDPVVTWGERAAGDGPFGFDDCWALRLRRSHVVGVGEASVACRHAAPGRGQSAACVPLATQGDVSGVLSLQVEGALSPARLQLARAVTDAVVLSLSNIQLRETLQHQSHSDPLTGLYNRRSMHESLDRELVRARRSGRPLGLCMVDVDHFKRFNDTFGHEAGDAVLVEVAKLLKGAVRGSDLVCRYGGEEFTVILPESPLPATLLRAEALRRGCATLRLRHQGRELPQITISVGVAELPDHASAVDDLLRQADAALYQAKQAGRNRVHVAEDTVLPPPADDRVDPGEAPGAGAAAAAWPTAQEPVQPPSERCAAVAPDGQSVEPASPAGQALVQ